MDSIPYSDVRAHLANTLKQLQARDEPVYISRRGAPAAVLMSVAQYQRLTAAPENNLWSALCAWRERNADYLNSPEAEEDPFANVRDRSPDGGRPPFEFDAPEPAPSQDAAGSSAQAR